MFSSESLHVILMPQQPSYSNKKVLKHDFRVESLDKFLKKKKVEEWSTICINELVSS